MPETTSGPGYLVTLRNPAADGAKFKNEVKALGAQNIQNEDTPAQLIQGSIHPQAVGWWLLALLAALAGVAVIGQAISRQRFVESEEFSTFGALGIVSRQLAVADNAVLFRSAVKQVCQRHGLLATFMCRPGLPNFFSSGWHLHQSLAFRPSGGNAFASEDGPLSEAGLSYVAGLLEHALPSLVFAAPTVNGYKRYRPYSFAPDRVCWAVENRERSSGCRARPATRAPTWRCARASLRRTRTSIWRPTSPQAWTG